MDSKIKEKLLENKSLIIYIFIFIILLVSSIIYYQSGKNTKVEKKLSISNVNLASTLGANSIEKDEILNCKHISKWDYSLSSCQITTNWSSSGEINCSQFANPVPIYADYKSTICNKDNAENTGPIQKDSHLKLSLKENTCLGQNSFANGKDECLIDFVIDNIPLEGVSGTPDGIFVKDLNFSNSSYLDQKTNSGATGLIFENEFLSGSIIRLKVKSIAPINNTGSLSFEIEGANGFTKMTFDDINFNFKKLFKGELNIEGGNNLKVGEDQTLNLKIDKIDETIAYKVSDFKKSTILQDQNFEFSDKVGERELDLNPKVEFNLRYVGSGIISNVSIYNDSYIEYELLGQKVKYKLGASYEYSDNNTLSLNLYKSIGAKVIGDIQIGNNNLRDRIRNKATEIISNIRLGNNLDNVIFVDGQNMVLNGEQSFETIIVRNGNVIIDGDLNPSGKPLGIIVLKDGYDTKADFSTAGNIYVNQSVGEINAYLYADGGLISSNNGIPYTSDNYLRKLSLKKQLVIKGNVFTKNTIGGTNLVDGVYLLPNNRKTSNLDFATIYDLNYLRRGNAGCDKNKNGKCNDPGEYEDSLVLIYSYMKIFGFE